jgi:NAD(P)-dependent dehydrogenase (short-subunit alcohol dehydrogenase family)
MIFLILKSSANMFLKMKNKYTLISASTSDIGKAIVTKILPSCNVILHGRNQNKLEAIAGPLDSHKILTWNFDLQNVDEINKSLSEFIISNKIVVDRFVHCAGSIKLLPIKHFGLEHARQIFDVNFFSAVEVVKTLLLKVNDKELKNIVFISALFSKFGNKGNSVYAASKGAIDSFVKSLATELAPKVRVNSILPGGLRTSMTNHLFDDPAYIEKFQEKYLLGEGAPDDIASMANFLLSNESKWITGQNYIVDGGCSSHL